MSDTKQEPQPEISKVALKAYVPEPDIEEDGDESN